MKLRLNEMVPVRVARRLREEGFDVDAVVEHSGLRGLPDALQLAQAAREGRALVCYDAADLLPLAARRAASGEGRAGLVLLRTQRFPRGQPARLTAGLRRLLTDSPGSHSFVHWLR